MRMRKRAVYAAVVLFGALALPALAVTWIVPGVFDGPGANGLLFSTDITLVNPDAVARSVTIVPILGPNGPVADPLGLVLAPGESRRFANPISGVGALRINSDGGVFVVARSNSFYPTLGPTPPVVRGTSLPVTEVGSLLHAGDTGHSIWVSQSSDPRSGERTNVGVVFPDGSGGTATVTVYGALGRPLGSATWDSPRAAALQMPIAAIVGGDLPARMAVAVTRGSVLAYAGSVDNATGDLAIVPAERVPEPRGPLGPVDVVSSGVAQTVGKGGVVWHTDARLANTGYSPAYVTAYLRTADGEAVPAARISLTPLETIEISDLVQSLFNVSTPVTGSVLWRSTRTIAVAIRTRSGDGATISASSVTSAVQVERFPSASDPPGQLADLREDSQFRTNLEAASGPGGAAFAVDLFDESGKSVGSDTESLPPLAWAQFPLDHFGYGGDLPARTRARVRVLSGTVLVSANVVESRSSDPVPARVPLGAAAASTGPAVPVGTWGAAPNGMDHINVDATGISVLLPCKTGNFSQPLSLDASGRFAVLGTWLVMQGPTVAYDAILMGQTDGHSLTFTVIAGTNFDTITGPETVVLGGAWGPFTGLCPIEY
jgi:hypothetical protein